MSSIPKATCLRCNHVSFLLRWRECLKTLNWWVFNTEWVLFPASILPLWPQWGKKGESYFREGAGYDTGESPSDRRGSRRKPSTSEDRSGTCGGREPGLIRLLANSPRHSPQHLVSGALGAPTCLGRMQRCREGQWTSRALRSGWKATEEDL